MKQRKRERREWRVIEERALKQYRNANSVQIYLMVDYLKALGVKRYVRRDKGEVEYNINEFDNWVGELVGMRRLRWYDRTVLFLEGLLVGIVREFNDGLKLDTKKLETFKRSGVFNEVGEAALYHNCTNANFNRLGLPVNQEP